MNSRHAVSILAHQAKPLPRGPARDAEWKEANDVVFNHPNAMMREINRCMYRHIQDAGRGVEPKPCRIYASYEEARDINAAGWHLVEVPSWWPFGRPQLEVK